MSHPSDDLSEARLGARGLVRRIFRLADGTFAPKGQGRVLRPGETVRIAGIRSDRDYKGVVSRDGKTVKLTDGPQAGELIAVTKAAPASPGYQKAKATNASRPKIPVEQLFVGQKVGIAPKFTYETYSEGKVIGIEAADGKPTTYVIDVGLDEPVRTNSRFLKLHPKSLPADQAPGDPMLNNYRGYLTRLAEHDWYFQMADDHGSWRAGSNEQKRLVDEATGDPIKQKMLADWKNYMFSGPGFDSEKAPRPELDFYELMQAPPEKRRIPEEILRDRIQDEGVNMPPPPMHVGYDEIDWENIADVNDPRLTLPEGIRERDPDTGLPPEGTMRVDRLDRGESFTDGAGNRFTRLGYGPVQGSDVVRDEKSGLQFQLSTDTIVRPDKPAPATGGYVDSTPAEIAEDLMELDRQGRLSATDADRERWNKLARVPEETAEYAQAQKELAAEIDAALTKNQLSPEDQARNDAIDAADAAAFDEWEAANRRGEIIEPEGPPMDPALMDELDGVEPPELEMEDSYAAKNPRTPGYRIGPIRNTDESYVINSPASGPYSVTTPDGKTLGEFTEWDDALAAIEADKEKQQFWPDTFLVNERGDIDRLDAEGNVMQEPTVLEDDGEAMNALGSLDMMKDFDKLGWAVQEQAEKLYMDGVDEDELNSNAVQMINDWLAKYDLEDFGPDGIADAIERSKAYSDLGWSIAGQLDNILQGEPLEDQNPNALEYIERFLRGQAQYGSGDADWDSLAEEVDNYLRLKRIDDKGGPQSPGYDEGLTDEQRAVMPQVRKEMADQARLASSTADRLYRQGLVQEKYGIIPGDPAAAASKLDKQAPQTPGLTDTPGDALTDRQWRIGDVTYEIVGVEMVDGELMYVIRNDKNSEEKLIPVDTMLAEGRVHEPTALELREAVGRKAVKKATTGARGLVRDIMRLDDGTFAPKGMGRVLKPGQEVRVPRTDGKGGFVRGRVNAERSIDLLDGPDAGTKLNLVSRIPQVETKRPPQTPGPDVLSDKNRKVVMDVVDEASRWTGGDMSPEDFIDMQNEIEDLLTAGEFGDKMTPKAEAGVDLALDEVIKRGLVDKSKLDDFLSEIGVGEEFRDGMKKQYGTKPAPQTPGSNPTAGWKEPGYKDPFIHFAELAREEFRTSGGDGEVWLPGGYSAVPVDGKPGKFQLTKNGEAVQPEPGNPMGGNGIGTADDVAGIYARVREEAGDGDVKKAVERMAADFKDAASSEDSAFEVGPSLSELELNIDEIHGLADADTKKKLDAIRDAAADIDPDAPDALDKKRALEKQVDALSGGKPAPQTSGYTEDSLDRMPVGSTVTVGGQEWDKVEQNQWESFDKDRMFTGELAKASAKPAPETPGVPGPGDGFVDNADAANPVSLEDMQPGTLFKLKNGDTYRWHKAANGGVIGKPVKMADGTTGGKAKFFNGKLAPKQINTEGAGTPDAPSAPAKKAAKSPGGLNLSNTGPKGNPRNVKKMSDSKLKAISQHPDVEPALKERVDKELTNRGLDVPGGGAKSAPPKNAAEMLKGPGATNADLVTDEVPADELADKLDSAISKKKGAASGGFEMPSSVAEQHGDKAAAEVQDIVSSYLSKDVVYSKNFGNMINEVEETLYGDADGEWGDEMGDVLDNALKDIFKNNKWDAEGYDGDKSEFLLDVGITDPNKWLEQNGVDASVAPSTPSAADLEAVGMLPNAAKTTSAAMAGETPKEWADAKKKYPADPVFPDGKPLSIRVKELQDEEGMTFQDAQDVALAELPPETIKDFAAGGTIPKPEMEAALDYDSIPNLKKGTKLNLSNTGPKGNLRNIKAMQPAKLKALIEHPDVDPDLRDRARKQLAAKGYNVPGTGGAAVPKKPVAAKVAPDAPVGTGMAPTYPEEKIKVPGSAGPGSYSEPTMVPGDGIKLNAYFSRKPEDSEMLSPGIEQPEATTVKRIVELDKLEYDDFLTNMLQDREWVKENNDISAGGESFAVIGPEGYAFLIDPQGADYPRYVAPLNDEMTQVIRDNAGAAAFAKGGGTTDELADQMFEQVLGSMPDSQGPGSGPSKLRSSYDFALGQARKLNDGEQYSLGAGSTFRLQRDGDSYKVVKGTDLDAALDPSSGKPMVYDTPEEAAAFAVAAEETKDSFPADSPSKSAPLGEDAKKIAAAWEKYNAKLEAFKAIPESDKKERARVAAQVRAAKYRIKKAGGDPDNPAQYGPKSKKAAPETPGPSGKAFKASTKKTDYGDGIATYGEFGASTKEGAKALVDELNALVDENPDGVTQKDVRDVLDFVDKDHPDAGILDTYVREEVLDAFDKKGLFTKEVQDSIAKDTARAMARAKKENEKNAAQQKLQDDYFAAREAVPHNGKDFAMFSAKENRETRKLIDSVTENGSKPLTIEDYRELLGMIADDFDGGGDTAVRDEVFDYLVDMGLLQKSAVEEISYDPQKALARWGRGAKVTPAKRKQLEKRMKDARSKLAKTGYFN